MGKAECNATEAARIAGYKHPNKHGPDLVKRGPIATEIKRRLAEEKKVAILTRQERQERLSEIAMAGELSCVCKECGGRFRLLRTEGDSIKSIDILNKMDGLYIQKLDIRAHLSKTPEQIESDVIKTYRENPELWKRIKEAVEK